MTAPAVARHAAGPPRLPALRVVEYCARVYRRNWRGTMFLTFFGPVLFLTSMGSGLGSFVDAGPASAAALGGPRVESRIADDLPPIAGDPLRLRQALDNLVSNALAHAGSEGAVVVSADSSEAAVLLSVADSGAGIPFSEQNRIFETGVRLNEATAGSGLGLAIARAIAEAHGGTLTVTSTPGQGATFTIAIPRT